MIDEPMTDLLIEYADELVHPLMIDEPMTISLLNMQMN